MSSVIRVGVQAPQGGPGQVVDIDGLSASSTTINNVSAESIAYSTNGGSSWATIAAASSASAGTVQAGQLRMRKVSSNGAAPAPVDVTLTENGKAESGFSSSDQVAIQSLVSEAGTTTWANRASVLAAGLSQAFFTDIGPYGSDWIYTGGRWRPRGGRVTLKNLTTAVSNSAAPKVVLDYATIPAGLWQDGDVLEIEFQKTRDGGTSDTDATDVMIGSAALTLGTSTGLSTGALTTTTIQLTPRYRLQRVSATSVRTATIPGGTGLGSATSAPTTTTGLPNADTLDTFLQVTSDLTTAGGEVSWLRAFTVTLIAA